MPNKFLKIIPLALSCVIFSAYARPVIVPAPPEMQKMFQRLKDAAGPGAQHATLEINKSVTGVANAFTFPDGSIVVWQGELNFDKGHPGFLEATLAHELGHVIHQDHTPRRQQMDSKQVEKEADIYSVWLMNKAGYGCKATYEYFKEMIKIQGPGHGGDSHPSNQERYNYLKAECGK